MGGGESRGGGGGRGLTLVMPDGRSHGPFSGSRDAVDGLERHAILQGFTQGGRRKR